MTIKMKPEEWMANENQNLSNSLSVVTLDEDAYMLSASASTGLVDTTNLSYKVVRFPVWKGSKKTMVIAPKETLFFKLKYEGEISEKKVLNIIAKSLKDFGYSPTIQGNDVFINKKKISGITFSKIKGFSVFCFFLSRKEIPKDMLKYVHYPEQYLNDKGIKNVLERIGFIDIDIENFEKTLHKNFKNEINVDLIKEKPFIKNPERCLIHNGS